MNRALIATTCIAITGMTSSAFAGETVTMWVRSGIGDALVALTETYNAVHEDKIALTEIPVSEMVQKYATAVAGGQAPDALSLDLIYTPAFAATGQLEDLTDWAEGLPYFASLAPSHVRLGTYEGRIYGLPLAVETSVFAWNKDLYKAAGLDPETAPTSWTEIAANAEAIRKLGGDTYGFYFSGGSCGGCMAFTFLPLVWAAGADILSADGTTATLDTKPMRAAMSLYRSMVEKGLVPESASTDNGSNFNTFQGGKVGQQTIGAFAIGNMVNKTPSLHFGVTLIPGIDGGASSFAGGDNIVATRGTPHLATVKDFIAYVYSPEGQRLALQKGSLPTRLDIADETLKDADPRITVAVAAIKVAKTPYTLLFNDLINSGNGPWAAFTHAAIYGSDVDGAFADAQSTMQSIIDNAAP